MKAVSETKIYLVWPVTDPTERIIGFGASRSLVASFLAVAVILLIDVVTLALSWPTVGITFWIVALAFFILLIGLAKHGRTYQYYELSSSGHVVGALGFAPPEEIKGRLPRFSR